MKKMDPDLEKFYSEGKEKDRLSIHQLERERTLHILKKRLPIPPTTILDIGGAAGAYAFPLSKQGYHVHLLDPVALHIEQAKSNPHKLSSIVQGDARSLPFASNMADAVLLLGPLYHLTEHSDRIQALREAYRVLKPNGVLFAAGISRFASLMDYVNKGVILSKIPNVENDLSTGIHKKSDGGFVFGYFHRPEDLKAEVQAAGFSSTTLHAIEGPVWAAKLLDPLYQEPDFSKYLSLLDSIETEESMIGASAHIMAIARKL
ncbi:MAG: class I SAM-dependent methyltransferase [Parachlamydiales bacterium]|nr:class I SAM-dependent methyltransferase [Parachlamydiales bacterium]